MTDFKPLLLDRAPQSMLAFAAAIAAAGGRAIVVGGYVRDRLLGLESKDFDFEVYRLPIERLEEVLRAFGEVIAVGRSFGVLKVKGFDGDFSIPRRDNKVGKGHTGFRVDFDPGMDFAEASRRRDLTINSIGFDPRSGELLDPHGGAGDLRRGVLRATDPARFAEDPLRGLRVAQFLARFEFKPDAELYRLSSSLDLADLSGERIWEEFAKLFLKSRRPSLGLEFLEQTGLLRFFPELQATAGVPQDPEWHPEGDVWVHTRMVVDEAAKLRAGDAQEDLVLLYGALCHDLGKATTTFTDEGGRIRSPNHEPEGVAPTERFLSRLRAPGDFAATVAALVRYHLAPAHFVAQRATPRAYRRLARKLGEAGLTLAFLERLARADHFGRTTPDALAREFPAGEAFLAAARALAVELAPVRDVVLGRHVLARGFAPGPAIGSILRSCRDVQDETGATDPERILDRVLAEGRWDAGRASKDEAADAAEDPDAPRGVGEKEE
jgi:tRNA nucleotidyltransferase (CCA-adding enzyme)